MHAKRRDDHHAGCQELLYPQRGARFAMTRISVELRRTGQRNVLGRMPDKEVCLFPPKKRILVITLSVSQYVRSRMRSV